MIIEIWFTNDQLQVASTIGANLAAQVVDVCAEQVDQFALTYKR